MITLSENAYGKDRVRLTKVVRDGATHSILEFTVHIRLQGEFEKVYTEDDNRYCVPTDTMRNTVYVLARKNTFDSPEEFARIIADHFVDNFEHIRTCEVRIEQNIWQRIVVEGKPQEHSFSKERSIRTAFVRREESKAEVRGGIRGLEVLKSTGSYFRDFLRDENTTLPEVDERIMATTVEAEWVYGAGATDSNGSPFNSACERARQIILEVFATHHSPSVQSTMYRTGERLLDAIPHMDSIAMVMPNQHHILFDLSPFGLKNDNEIFVGTDAPAGVISATISRD